MRTTKIYLTLILLLVASLGVQGQSEDIFQYPDSTFVKIRTTDGSEIYGYFLRSEDKQIIIGAENFGEVRLYKISIKKIEALQQDRLVEGYYWYENPNATRYLFSPSAIPLRKGEGYYQNSYLVMNMVNVGVTDQFSMGGGFELISTFTGNPTLFITPKLSGQVSKDVYLGVGTIAGFSAITVEGTSDMIGFGICYGVATFGNRDNNFTAGLGFGFLDGSFSEKPILTLSGMTRISRKLGFVSENWILPGDGYDYIISYALRFMSEKITVDFGFINNADIAQNIPIGYPYIDFVVKFGK